MRAYLLLAAILALIGTHWYAYSAGESRERDRNTASASVQKDKTAELIDQRDQRSATNNTSMIDWLAANIPPIQVKADESAERIRTVYRDRVVTVGAECSRPAGVQVELDAARARANSTGTALQAPAYAPGRTGTDPAIGR